MTDLSASTSSFALSAAALAAVNEDLSKKTALRVAADSGDAAAKADKAAAVDAHASLAAKLAAGEPIKAADTARAATAVRDAEAHAALTASALEIALAKENTALDEHARAVDGHAKHEVARAYRERAAACRDLAASASVFSATVASWQEAGRLLIAAQNDAWAARAARLGPAARSRGGALDLSTVAPQYSCAALPGYLLGSIRENLVEHRDFAAEADRMEVEAERVAR